MSEEINKLNENVNLIVKDYRERIEKLEKSNDGVTRAELETMKSEVASELKAFRDAVAAANAPRVEYSPEESIAQAKEAFGTYLTYGDKSFPKNADGLLIKDVSLTMPTEGGVFLPKIFSGEMTDKLRKASPIRNLARVVRSNKTFVHPIKTTSGSADTRAEKGSIAAKSSIGFDMLTFNDLEINARQVATAWAHDGDAQVSLVDMVMMDIAASIGEKEGDFFLNSTNQNALAGGGNVKTGILANTKGISGVDRFTNTPGTLSGVASATLNAITLDDILALRATLHGKYLANAVYVMGSDTELALLSIKDNEGNYIMSAGNVTNGLPNTLFGNSYLVDDNMPAMAAGGARIVLGDFSKYMIVDNSDFRWIRNEVSDYTVVEYFAGRRTAGAITDAQAFRCLYNKAS